MFTLPHLTLMVELCISAVWRWSSFVS